jgi:hypothetical protein
MEAAKVTRNGMYSRSKCIYIYEILPYIFLSMFSYSGVYVIQALPLFRDPRSHTTENDAVVEQEELQLI